MILEGSVLWDSRRVSQRAMHISSPSGAQAHRSRVEMEIKQKSELRATSEVWEAVQISATPKRTSIHVNACHFYGTWGVRGRLSSIHYLFENFERPW